MLLLDSSLEAHGLTFYRDHVVPDLFHYLPSAPRIVTEGGLPRAQLVRFRSLEGGGGFLTLDVELGPDAATLDAARREFATSLNVEATLVPVLFTAGSARLSVLDVQPDAAAKPPARFVENVLATCVPSLAGHCRAIFSVKLTPEASTLVQAALKGGTVPALIVYEMAFSGLAPARGLKASIQYRMAYDYLRGRFNVNSLYFKTDLDREIESMQQNGLITIEDVDYKGVDDATRAKRAEEVRSILAGLMRGLYFRPAASPATAASAGSPLPTGPSAAWAAAGRPQAGFVFRSLDQREQDTVTYDLTEARPSTEHVAPQGMLRLPAGADPAKVILDSTLDWPPPITSVRAFSLPDADWSGVAAVTIDLRQAGAIATLLLTPAHRDQTVKLTAGPVDYRMRVQTRIEADALGVTVPADSAFAPLTTAYLFVDPVALSGRRELRIALGAIDLTVVQKISGRLEASGASRSFQLDAKTPEVAVPVWGATPVRMRATLALAGGESISLDRVILPTEPVALINLPGGAFHVVAVMLQDPLQRYASVSVTLEAAAGARRQNFTLDADSPVQHWSAPRNPGAPATFRYKARKVLRDASVVEGDWTEASGSLVTVGDTDIRIETVQGVLAGFPEFLGGLIRLEPLNAVAGVGPTEIVLDPGQKAFEARLALPRDAAREYSVSGQVFFETGSIDLPARKEVSEVLILTPPRPAATSPALSL